MRAGNCAAAASPARNQEVPNLPVQHARLQRRRCIRFAGNRFMVKCRHFDCPAILPCLRWHQRSRSDRDVGSGRIMLTPIGRSACRVSIAERLATEPRPKTTGRSRLFSPPCTVRSIIRSALRFHLDVPAEEPGRPHDQDADHERERVDILIAAGEIAAGQRFDDADDQPAGNGPRQAAETADDG